ncbi:DUF1097 domain-containing protein [Mycolicibacterium baixiangningiae]|uniref:DUF1097 domain-containing protein n=1 Tax=Mycolicibacterium baixiangningiae TaxID=2761578 RepID=UPI0018D15C29|nr:DUF1097 domain-containing protein [Mycolicibacterium baixiangningiae]
MNERAAATLVIGVLGAASFLVTIYLVTVPIWALFIAWASFVAAGGGITGVRRSLPMAIVGILSATATLLVAHALGGGAWVTALCIVFGAGALVAIGRFELFAFTPASFFGFASTVGIIGVTGRSIAEVPSVSHPAAIALMAMVLGTAFGFVAEQLAGALSRTASSSSEVAGNAPA